MLPGLMSHNFWCDIQMVGSEFGKNTMKGCIQSALYRGTMWATTEHSLNATVHLSIVADHVHLVMNKVHHLLMAILK